MLRTSLAFVFTVFVPILVLGQDNPCPKSGSGFYPDPQQCDKYWECRKGKATPKLCSDGLVFNPRSPLYERCQYPFSIDCTDRPSLQDARPRRHCPRGNGLFPHDSDCSAFWQCNGGLARIIRCQGQLAFNPATGTCQWPHLVPGCENPDAPGAPGPVVAPVDEKDEDHVTVTTTSRPGANRQGSRNQQSSRRQPAPAAPVAPVEPAPQPTRSRSGSRNRQNQPRSQAPPAQTAPEVAPIPFQPAPPPPRRIPSYNTPQRNNEGTANAQPDTPANLPLPVPFQPQPPRRIPTFSQPQRNTDSASEDNPAEPAPTRSQSLPGRRVPVQRGTEAPAVNEPAEAPQTQPPRRVVFRRPVTTTQAAPPSDDYNYDDFSK